MLADLNRFVIKPAARNIGQSHNYPAGMSSGERSAFLARLNAAPQHFIAQEIVPGSSIPVLTNENQMVAGKCVIRTFQVASDSGYHVMPGGLARVSTSSDPLAESALGGQGSKDVWVLGDGPVAQVSLLHPAGTLVSLQRSRNRSATHSVIVRNLSKRVCGHCVVANLSL